MARSIRGEMTGYAHRAHVLQRRLRQRKDEVDVVDHQIQDHRGVRPSGLKRRHAQGLDEPRPIEPRFRGEEDAIEALDVSDPENDALLLRERDDLVRLRQAGRERLLDECVAPRADRGGRSLAVRRGGHRNDDGFDPVEQRLRLREGGHGQAVRDLPRPRGRPVVDPLQLERVALRQEPGVLGAQLPDPDDAGRDPAHTADRVFASRGSGGRSSSGPTRVAVTPRSESRIELNEFPHLGGHVSPQNAVETCPERVARPKDRPVCGLQRANRLRLESPAFEADTVDAVRAGPTPSRERVRCDVARDARAASDHRMPADPRELVDAVILRRCPSLRSRRVPPSSRRSRVRRDSR